MTARLCTPAMTTPTAVRGRGLDVQRYRFSHAALACAGKAAVEWGLAGLNSGSSRLATTTHGKPHKTALKHASAVLLKFVADKPRDLSSGVLSAAKFKNQVRA